MAKAEEIFNQFCTLMSKDYREYIIKDKKGFIKAIDQLASQSRPAVLMPEEEEIKQEAIKAANRSQFMSNWIYDHKSYEEGYLIGAKWALSQVQAIDGRELLERFKKWQKLNHYDASERNTDVDAFLRDNAT